MSASRIDNDGQKWTVYLILCCIVTCLSSFQFGYNIGVTNLPTKVKWLLGAYIYLILFLKIITDFYMADYINLINTKWETFNSKKQGYLSKLSAYKEGMKNYTEGELKYAEGIKSYHETKYLLEKYYREGNLTLYDELLEKSAEKTFEIMNDHGMTVEDYLKDSRRKLDAGNITLTNATGLLADGKQKIEEGAEQLNAGGKRIEKGKTILWTITNTLFVLGGMIGAVCSKPLSDKLGRRMSLIAHNLFSIIGAILVLMSYFLEHYAMVKASRFFFGLQGGMACTLVPAYLNEISPPKLRGSIGVISQFNITIGIMLSQLFGFRQILGTNEGWRYLLALPIIPALACSILLYLFFTETPISLLNKNKKKEAVSALKKLRDSTNVEDEICQMENELKQSKNSDSLTFVQLIKSKEYRWPLITGVVVQLAQQLCGINAIFFYSESIFKNAGISITEIQYAVLSTGIINVIATIFSFPLIERAGRKPLLVYPLIFMVFDFILLTIFLKLQYRIQAFSYVAIVCVILFIISFAIGLGPIPFIYVAECFRPNAKNAALSICILVNWTASLILTVSFQYLAMLLENYVFLIFAVIAGLVGLFVAKKVPETRNKSTELILAKFNSNRHYDEQEIKFITSL